MGRKHSDEKRGEHLLAPIWEPHSGILERMEGINGNNLIVRPF